MVRALLVVLACMALIVAAGCRSAGEGKTSVSVAPITPQAPTPEEKTPAGASASPSAFRWTPTPTLQDIPAHPVQGMLNGASFVPQYVVIERDYNGISTDITFSDKAPDAPGGHLEGNSAFELRFARPAWLKTGSFTKTLSQQVDFREFHAFYHYPEPDGVQMTVAQNWACAFEITEITPDNDPTNDISGIALGRIALCIDDESHSWLAGEFRAYIVE